MACAGGGYVVLNCGHSWFPTAQCGRDYRALDIDAVHQAAKPRSHASRAWLYQR